MEIKIYKCICGKEFNDKQKFNGHKSHCKEHQQAKYGSLDVYNDRFKQQAITRAKTIQAKSSLLAQHKVET